jgi:hypothetical protein
MAETSKAPLYSQLIMAAAGSCIAAVVSFGLAKADNLNDWVGIFLIVCFFAAIWRLGSFFGDRHARRVARRRAGRAEQILAHLRRGLTSPPFGFYLRPFDTTTTPAEQPSGNPRGARELEKPWRWGNETLFADAVAEWHMDVIALARRGEHVGAAAIEVGDPEWRGTANLLARHASVLYLVVDCTPGTLWELKLLLNTGLIGRTILMMPPDSGQRSAKSRMDLRWDKARELARTIGLQFPLYDPEGQLFTISTQGAVENTRPIGRTYSDLRDSIFLLTWKLQDPRLPPTFPSA